MILQHIDIAAVVMAVVMVAALAVFFNKTRIGRALARGGRRPPGSACRSAFRSTRSGPSCGSQRASWRWQPASCGVPLGRVVRAEIVALKALPVLISAASPQSRAQLSAG
jgi:hypothetical protein